MYEPKRLHPISYLTKTFKALKSNFITIIVAVFFVVKNGVDINNPNFGDLIFPAVLLIGTVISVVVNVVESIRTSYWIADDKLIVKSGFISTDVKELYISRIQSMEVTKNIINQVFGGVILEVKTPGEGVKLDTISKHSAEALTQYLETRKEQLNSQQSEVTDTAEFTAVYRLRLKDILLMSVTSGAMGTVLAVGSGLYFQLDEIFHFNKVLKPLTHLMTDGFTKIAVMALLILLLSYMTGILITALKYFRYELMYDGERLKIRHGLFEVKEKMIVVAQIQAVSEEKSFLRQLLGFTAFKATITSDAQHDEDLEGLLGEVEILPFIKRREGIQAMERLIPSYRCNEVKRLIPKRSLRRYVQWPALFVITASSIIQHYLFDKAWMACLAFLCIILLSSYMKYRFSGFVIEGDQITVKEVGLFSSKTRMIKEDKLIAVHLLDNYFLRNAQLKNVELQNSAGSINMTTSLKLVDTADAEVIYSWFMHKEDEQYEGYES